MLLRSERNHQISIWTTFGHFGYLKSSRGIRVLEKGHVLNPSQLTLVCILVSRNTSSYFPFRKCCGLFMLLFPLTYIVGMHMIPPPPRSLFLLSHTPFSPLVSGAMQERIRQSWRGDTQGLAFTIGLHRHMVWEQGLSHPIGFAIHSHHPLIEWGRCYYFSLMMTYFAKTTCKIFIRRDIDIVPTTSTS